MVEIEVDGTYNMYLGLGFGVLGLGSLGYEV